MADSAPGRKMIQRLPAPPPPRTAAAFRAIAERSSAVSFSALPDRRGAAVMVVADLFARPRARRSRSGPPSRSTRSCHLAVAPLVVLAASVPPARFKVARTRLLRVSLGAAPQPEARTAGSPAEYNSPFHGRE